jgi:hypothetical protein
MPRCFVLNIFLLPSGKKVVPLQKVLISDNPYDQGSKHYANQNDYNAEPPSALSCIHKFTTGIYASC